MLHLNDFKPIAISKTRHCYLHPNDPGKVIKIIVDPQEKAKSSDVNKKEWRYYQRLKETLPIPLDFIPRYHGFEATDLGTGLVSDCIRDYDGKISVRLKEVIFRNVGYDRVEVAREIETFTQNLIRYNIQLFDLNPFNILIRVNEDGSYAPVAIDIKAPYNNYEFIPISTYIPFFSRRKLIRRSKRLLEMFNK